MESMASVDSWDLKERRVSQAFKVDLDQEDHRG